MPRGDANAVWAWAAADERHCYTYINLAFFNQAGSYTDTCYDPGSHATRENAWVISASVLLTVLGAALACRGLERNRRRVAFTAAVVLSATAVCTVVAIGPFKSVPVPKLAPPWWPGPVTPPIWAFPVLPRRVRAAVLRIDQRPRSTRCE